MTATTPWGLVHRVGQLYEKYRRLRVDGRYNAFGRGGPPDSSRNWPHFSRAADVIWANNMDPEEYVAAQFIVASKLNYPRPNNLYSKRAFENWQRVNFMPRLRDAWEHNNMYLGILQRRFALTVSEVVRNPYWDWFAPWFRVVFLDEEDLPLYADEGIKALESDSVRRLLEEIGEDVAALETRLYNAKERMS